jgi:hypothetical protein
LLNFEAWLDNYGADLLNAATPLDSYVAQLLSDALKLANYPAQLAGYGEQLRNCAHVIARLRGTVAQRWSVAEPLSLAIGHRRKQAQADSDGAADQRYHRMGARIKLFQRGSTRVLHPMGEMSCPEV